MNTTTGNTFDELIETLKTLERQNHVKKIHNNASRLNIRCRLDAVNQKISDWELDVDGIDVQTPPCSKGTTFAELKTALNDMNQSKNLLSLHYSCDVLCFLDAEVKKFGGKIGVRFFRIEPGFPYTIDKQGQPHFRTISFDLSDWEYERIMETRIAFFCEGVIYPITKKAADSVGSVLDCSAAFKTLDQHPLGSALLLSEKFETTRRLNVVYRTCTDLVKPIESVVLKKYVHYPQYVFFDTLHTMLSQRCHYGFFDIRSWSASDRLTVLDLKLTADPDYGIELKTGDFSGISMSVTAYYMVNGCKLPLICNTESHMKHFADGGYDRLLENILESIENFKNRKPQNAVYKSEYMTPIFSVLGVKRTQKIKISLVENQIYDVDDMLRTIITESFFKLSVKQDKNLRYEYMQLFKHLLAKEEDINVFDDENPEKVR